MKPLKELKEWQDLIIHRADIADQSMQDWFAENPLRAQQFSLQNDDILLDYSKNRVTTETLTLFNKLAEAICLPEKIRDLFSGKPLNFTEQRPALHTALRNQDQQAVLVNERNIMPDITGALIHLKKFSDSVRQGHHVGATGKAFRHIVNIGIGGSHLGPLFTTDALADYALDHLQCYFVSQIDGHHLKKIIEKIDPETTLFIISSKTFTTLETLTNAKTLRSWLESTLGIQNLSKHFVAVTAATEKALAFGIPSDQIFPVWDWVGGRFSVWSAIGLPLILIIGMENFELFLKGAYAMDCHFRNAPLLKNMPFILAVIGIWYINFFDATTHAVIPYAQQLRFLRNYLQQLDMESNGKRIATTGLATPHLTGPIIWGDHGSDGQHAFLQLIHQGHHLIPVDFILIGESSHSFSEHQDILIASALSQAKALMQGKTLAEAHAELCNQGYSEAEADALAIHKTLPGNRPSNTLFIKKLTPFNLGSLLALYEHKIFVQGVFWQINSFDQWGVELGKQLLPRILNDLLSSDRCHTHDGSTMQLIQHYKNLRIKS